MISFSIPFKSGPVVSTTGTKAVLAFVEKSVCGCNFGPSVGCAPATNGFPVDFGGVSRALVVVCCGGGGVAAGDVFTVSDDWFGCKIGGDVGDSDGAVVGTLIG